MVPLVIAFLPLLFSAEIIASWLIWARAPNDSIRVQYSYFWIFEAGRLHYWVSVLIVIAAGCVVGLYFLRRRQLYRAKHVHGSYQRKHFIERWTLGVGLTLALEIITSALYWRSEVSYGLRDVFQSAWYWHRVPKASDMGWPSFRIYMWEHVVPWAVVVLLGLALGYLRNRRKRAQSVATNVAAGR
jgi:hypothetical protein